MITLPNDVERCPGYGDDKDGRREGCDDCARRLSEPTGETVPWMEPPPIIAFWCEFHLS